MPATGTNRLQQRLVEQLGVQPRHPQALALELLAQHAERVVLTVGPHVRRAGQPAHRLVVVGLGQHVGALEPLQLQPVLEQPQELVGRGHVGGVVAADVAAGAERGQRVHRRGHVQRFVVAAVHELQQLNGEFDVAQPAGAELDLAGPHPGGHQFLDAAGASPAPRARSPHARRPSTPSASARRCTARRVRRRRRRAAPSAAPGIPTSWPTAGSRRCATPGCAPVGRACPRVAAPRRPRRTSRRRTASSRRPPGSRRQDRPSSRDEDDVDVADVVQFARTALAHRDHRQPRAARRRRRRPSGSPRSARRPARRRPDRTGEHRRWRTAARARSRPSRPGRGRPAPSAGPGRAPAAVAPQTLAAVRRFRRPRRTRAAAPRPTAASPGPPAGARTAGGRRGGRRAPATNRAHRTAGRAAPWSFTSARLSSSQPAERVGQPHHRAQRGVGVGRARQRPQQFDVGVGVPAQPVQIRRRGRFDQSEPADAGQLGSLRRGFGHAHDGSARRYPRRYRPLQGQVGLQFERRDVAAVVLPLGALVAQEEVEHVLPQRFRDQLGGLHLLSASPRLPGSSR